MSIDGPNKLAKKLDCTLLAFCNRALSIVFVFFCGLALGYISCLQTKARRHAPTSHRSRAEDELQAKGSRACIRKKPRVTIRAFDGGTNGEKQSSAADVDPYCRAARKGYLSVDDYFMAMAFLSGQRSKDPRKQARP